MYIYFESVLMLPSLSCDTCILKRPPGKTALPRRGTVFTPGSYIQVGRRRPPWGRQLSKVRPHDPRFLAVLPFHNLLPWKLAFNEPRESPLRLDYKRLWFWSLPATLWAAYGEAMNQGMKRYPRPIVGKGTEACWRSCALGSRSSPQDSLTSRFSEAVGRCLTDRNTEKINACCVQSLRFGKICHVIDN